MLRAELPSLDHITNEDSQYVYLPESDTLALLDALLQEMPYIRSHQPITAVEVGSGSGVVSTWLSSHLNMEDGASCHDDVFSGVSPMTHCVAVDCTKKACDLTRRTAVANDVALDCIRSDLLRAFRPGSVDLIVFNPPYVPSPSSDTWTAEREITIMNEHKRGGYRTTLDFALDGGVDGCEVVNRFISTSLSALSPGGLLYLLIIEANNPEKIIASLQEHGLDTEIIFRRTVPGERIMILRSVKRI